MSVVSRPTTGRLPFAFQVHSGGGRLSLNGHAAGALRIERVELDVATPVVSPGDYTPERYQNQRTRLRGLTVRLSGEALSNRIASVATPLAEHGITAISAKMAKGFVSVRGHVIDGPATAYVTFRIDLATAGNHLRALASDIRVHGYLATPGPVIADRMLTALLGATETADLTDRPHARSLCDVEIDLIRAALWRIMPPAGWRLPTIADVELSSIRIGGMATEVVFGPAGSRGGGLAIRPVAAELAAAHDLMHTPDSALRAGQIEEAMRGYRALLASGGHDQPFVLERILSIAAARPMWFVYGREVARQALGQWPQFAAAHSALASITLAQGDAREAAGHLARVAQLATDDEGQASHAALAGARLLRVLDPVAATKLYELAVERDPHSPEVVDALADRLADEQRWPELVQLLRHHAQRAENVDAMRAVALRLRLAEIHAQRLSDIATARVELAAAQTLGPEELSVHEMTATLLAPTDPGAAQVALQQMARLAVARQDRRIAGRAQTALGELLARSDEPGKAKRAWQRAIDLDPAQTDAMLRLARAHADRGDHDAAVELYQRLLNLGLAPDRRAHVELHLARSLVALERTDDAQSALQRATPLGDDAAAEAHVILAEIASRSENHEQATAQLDSAIRKLIELANSEASDHTSVPRRRARAAELAVMRAIRLDNAGQLEQANAEWTRAHELAETHAPAIAREAAHTMLSRAASAAEQRRWIDAALATLPPVAERASLLVSRAECRAGAPELDVAGALADLHEALAIADESSASIIARRRAYGLQSTLLVGSVDHRARATALAALAELSENPPDRLQYHVAAAKAWLLENEPRAARLQGARAYGELTSDVPTDLRRDVLATFGEAAWRQRAWPDVVTVYRELLGETEAGSASAFRYRLAVASDHQGDLELALLALRPLTTDVDVTPVERGQALLLYADLAERAGNLAAAGAALERLGQLVDCPIVPTAHSRADAQYRAGEMYRRADSADDAIRCLEAALQLSAAHVQALEALVTILQDRGDRERAIEVARRSVAATEGHPQRHKLALARLSGLQDPLPHPPAPLDVTHRSDADASVSTPNTPSVRITGTYEQNSEAVNAAAAAADRERILAAHREFPNDPSLLAALLANLGDRDPELRRAVLERTAAQATGRAQAIALHQLALGAQGDTPDPIRAAALLNKAYRVDPTYAPVWMPFADALSGAEEYDLAGDLYRKVAESPDYSAPQRAFARDRAGTLRLANHGDSTVSANRQAEEPSQGNAEYPPRDANRDERTALAAHFELAEGYRAKGDLAAAITQLERLLRDYPDNVTAIEKLAELYAERNNWQAATRYLYQLVPFAPTPAERAERLYQLGETILTRLGDVERADDAFLRASDLDPLHIPTLRRLLDVYWRADDPAALVEVARQLAGSSALPTESVATTSLARALVAAALVRDFDIAAKLATALGDAAPQSLNAVLGELAERNRNKFSHTTASTAIAELGHKGVLNVSMAPPNAAPN